MFVIRDWLCVGRYSEALDGAALRLDGIEATLQLAVDVRPPGIVSMYLPVEDGEPIPSAALRRGVGFVRRQRESGRKVLIACHAGISRSAAFAVAALKEEESLGLLEAWRQVCARHPAAMPHPALWESLGRYYGEAVSLREIAEVRNETE